MTKGKKDIGQRLKTAKRIVPFCAFKGFFLVAVPSSIAWLSYQQIPFKRLTHPSTKKAELPQKGTKKQQQISVPLVKKCVIIMRHNTFVEFTIVLVFIFCNYHPAKPHQALVAVITTGCNTKSPCMPDKSRRYDQLRGQLFSSSEEFWPLI